MKIKEKWNMLYHTSKIDCKETNIKGMNPIPAITFEK